MLQKGKIMKMFSWPLAAAVTLRFEKSNRKQHDGLADSSLRRKIEELPINWRGKNEVSGDSHRFTEFFER